MTDRFPSPVRTLGILRGYSRQRTVELAQRCWEAGIDLVEVPVQNDEAWRALEAVVARAAGRPVAAGTVTTVARARRAIDAGADALVMPGTDPDVVETARDRGTVVLPGVMTPSEVQACQRLGLDACKLFPIGTLGVGHLKALRPVFPETCFVATGGVGPANAEDLVRAGVNALAFGGSIESVLADGHTVAAARQITEPWTPTPPPSRSPSGSTSPPSRPDTGRTAQ